MKRKRLFAFIMSLTTVFLLIDFTFLNDIFESISTKENKVSEIEISMTETEEKEAYSDAVIEIAEAEAEIQETAEEEKKVSVVKQGGGSKLFIAQAKDIDFSKPIIVSGEQTVTSVLETSGVCIINYAGTDITITEVDFKILCRIVEAEASIEDRLGKQLVANVVLNRVVSDHFPNSIEGVVFDKGAFGSIDNGRYSSVDVEEDTIEAVRDVINGADESKGAVYFLNKKSARPKYINMFEREFIHLFQHGHHDFYKE